MKKYFSKFADNVLSHSEQRSVSGGLTCRTGVKCWCPGAGQGCCAGTTCTVSGCGGREGCT